MTLPITTLLASGLALWLIILSANVVRQRGAAKVSLGDGGDEMLQRRNRAQGNLIEYAPIMVLMVALAEFQGANMALLAIVAALFFAARLAHGYALSFSTHSPKGRMFGASMTFITIIVLALHNLLMFLL